MDAGVKVTKGEAEVAVEEVEAGEEEEEEEESSLPYGLGEMMDKGLWNSGVEEMEEEEQMWKVAVEEVVMKGVVAVEELMEDQG